MEHVNVSALELCDKDVALQGAFLLANLANGHARS
jgi:hypothetical protein